MNTHFQGKITELQVAEQLLSNNIQVSQPLVSDSRYDFIIDINNVLLKIQVKTSQVAKDNSYFQFATSSSHTNTKRTFNRSYNSNEIDYFATIYENQCYIIPYSDCGVRNQRLRLKPGKNTNKRGTKYAEDYTLNKFIEKRNK